MKPRKETRRPPIGHEDDPIYRRDSVDTPDDRPTKGTSIDYGSFFGNKSSTSFDDVFSSSGNGLTGLGFQSQDDFINQLHDLLQSSSNMNDDQKADWNKQILDTLLQYLLQKENRTYNESLRDEQRSYDLPIAQLVRLMSTGMSRDAALQYLTGGGSGSSGVPFSDLMQLPSSAIPATESTRNGVESRVSIANAVFNGIQTLMSCCSTGMGIAQGIQVVKGLTMQNFMSQENLQKYKDVNSFASGIQQIANKDSAFKTALSGMSNGQDLYNYINQNKTNPNIEPLVKSGLFDSVFGSTVGRSMFNDYWKTVRDTRDAGTILDNYLKQQSLQNLAANLDMSKVSAEIGQIGMQNKLYEQQIINAALEAAKIQEDTESVHQDNLLKQFSFDDNVRLARATADSAEAQAGINTRLFELNEAGFPMVKQTYLDKLQDEMLEWSLITDPANYDKRIQYWLNNRDNQQFIAYLNALDSNIASDFAYNHPGLHSFIRGMKRLFGDLNVKESVNAVKGVAGTLVKALPK